MAGHVGFVGTGAEDDEATFIVPVPHAESGIALESSRGAEDGDVLRICAQCGKLS